MYLCSLPKQKQKSMEESCRSTNTGAIEQVGLCSLLSEVFGLIRSFLRSSIWFEHSSSKDQEKERGCPRSVFVPGWVRALKEDLSTQTTDDRYYIHRARESRCACSFTISTTSITSTNNPVPGSKKPRSEMSFSPMWELCSVLILHQDGGGGARVLFPPDHKSIQ